MILTWTIAGATGAAIAFIRSPWPAVGIRIRHFGLVLLAGLASLGLWLWGWHEAWGLGIGWLAAHMILQSSHGLTRAGGHAWLRGLAAVALVGLVTWMVEGD